MVDVPGYPLMTVLWILTSEGPRFDVMLEDRSDPTGRAADGGRTLSGFLAAHRFDAPNPEESK